MFPKKGKNSKVFTRFLGKSAGDKEVAENYIFRYESYALGFAFNSSQTLQARITSYHGRFAKI